MDDASRFPIYLTIPDIIVIGVAIILLFFCYHPPNFELLHEHKSKREQLKELDYPGMFLWTAGLVIFLMGISWVGLTPSRENRRAYKHREVAYTPGSLPPLSAPLC